MIARVIVNHGSKQVDRLFDYAVPDGMELGVGARVMVPFGRGDKQREAFVMAMRASTQVAENKLKTVSRVVDECVLAPDIMKLVTWMRDKYICSFLDVIKAAIPPVMTRNTAEKPDKFIKMASSLLEPEEAKKAVAELRQSRATVQAQMLDILSYNSELAVSDLLMFSGGSRNTFDALVKKGLVTVYDREVFRSPLSSREYTPDEPPVLNSEQEYCVRELTRAIESGKTKSFLLHGVTGSGKTEVMLRAIAEVIKKGKQAMVLVPEISLTPQMIARFAARFGDRIAVMHSGLSMGERYDEWKRIKNGDADVVIGARSAVFAPLARIGIIIMDEEHEASYKSESVPRYTTSEVALFRAAESGAVFVAASATPLVSSYNKVSTGEYTLLELKTRTNKAPLPEVKIVDMREELEKGNRSVFSGVLRDEIEKNLNNKEQTILFLNRRGFSTFVSCRSCGHVIKCKNCNISMTYHSYSNTLKCHYCGYSQKNPTSCPECSSEYIRYFGGGTQKVQAEVEKLFPSASIVRMDVDTTGGKHGHEKLLEDFSVNKKDILIGTQMVAKGLDFPNVTLVGVISADTMLNVGDFRAEERTFELLEQVTGRAGRADKTGRAIIQTYSPDNYAVQLAKNHDYSSFCRLETDIRKAMQYPPFCELVTVLFTGDSENNTMQCSRFFAKHIMPLAGKDIKILGPVPAAISKINNKYRYRILIKCPSADKITCELVDAAGKCAENAMYERVSVVIDKNPCNIC